MNYISFKRGHFKLFNDIKTLPRSYSQIHLLYTTNEDFTRRTFTLSKKCIQNTLTSHLVPHFRELCKNFETNALVINKVRVCSILKPGDNVQLSTGNVTEVNVTAGRAVGKKQTLVPRDWRPLNNKKSKMFWYRKTENYPSMLNLAPILTYLSWIFHNP